MPQRSLSYSGLDEIDTGLQHQRSTQIQSQNRYMERTGEPRNRMPPLGNLTSEDRIPSATRTARQTGFDELTGKAREPAAKGQHSYAINNSPQNKSSTYDPNKHCAFHDQKDYSAEECRAVLCSQSANEKTSEDTEEEEEEPATPNSNRKATVSSNRRNRETEPESPSSPPPALKQQTHIQIDHGQAQVWPSDHAQAKLGRYVATKLKPSSVATHTARSLRSDQAQAKLGLYVVTKLKRISVAT
ncbi:hypothetical protein F2Q69_00007556 [Brassica cretica]|uniref:Uncharacterized protein n=1 Tax=Brassica cretica TaxID=69181 RepID=A0A8S9P3T7_BRACR|nr:hypothetical protein F2Q69_00007556 [Brassica cretica]